MVNYKKGEGFCRHCGEPCVPVKNRCPNCGKMVRLSPRVGYHRLKFKGLLDKYSMVKQNVG